MKILKGKGYGLNIVASVINLVATYFVTTSYYPCYINLVYLQIIPIIISNKSS
jgi:hypothetical protein